jgi:dihydroorotase
VRTRLDAAAYRDRILAALPEGADFTPLMTLYLTETTEPDDVVAAQADGLVSAVKLYPAGATTNSDAGVRDLAKVRPEFEAMQRVDLPLLIHGEVTDPEIDIFDREAVFIERVLIPLRRAFPELRIVLEHVTTAEGIAYVQDQAQGLQGATLTPHHLMINRTDLFRGGIRPHLYCLPIAKREAHRLALREAAVSGDRRFFLGTDSAPHAIGDKESACGCAGVFNAPVTLACLAEVFEQEGALDRLEGFASLHGPDFYRLPPNEDTVTLVRRPPGDEAFADIAVAPDTRVRVFRPDAPLHWSVAA